MAEKLMSMVGKFKV